jgi:hypothetical protein
MEYLAFFWPRRYGLSGIITPSAEHLPFMSNIKLSSFLTFLIISLMFCAFSTSAQALEKLIKGASPEVSPSSGMYRTPAPVYEDTMLIVTDVIVDQTADNAVVARDEAIKSARRLAFQKLAERHLAAGVQPKVPDDVVLATLVQDFEIKNEQLSSTRYVGNFTVRFRDKIRNFISVPVVPQARRRVYDTSQMQTATQPSAENGAVPPTTENGAMPPGWQEPVWNEQGTVAHLPDTTKTIQRPATGKPPVSGMVLILPYYENMAGKTVLWEDPNPWRDIWQNALPRNQTSQQVVVPLGDISDVAAGPADSVWSGSYNTVEKLRQQYGVQQVVLAVANKSGAYMTIDIHVYDGRTLRRRNAVTPYVGEKSDDEAWRQSMYDVLSYLQRPQRGAEARVEDISRSLTAQRNTAVEIDNAAVTTYAPPERPAHTGNPYPSGYQQQAPTDSYAGPRPSFVTTNTPHDVPPNVPNALNDPYARTLDIFGAATEVEVTFMFNNFSDWVDVQKRLSSMSPPVRMDIRALSSNSARFVLKHTGSVDTLRQALSAQGIRMGPLQTAAGVAPFYDLQIAP